MSGHSRIKSPYVAVIAIVISFLNAHAAVLYVDLNSTNPVPPFASWNTAATNIQDAVDLANAGDQVLVADGTYQQGNRLTSDGVANRVVITNFVALRSVNGASVTSIDGGQAVRCVSLTNGASLVGFTLTRGKGGNGGGVNCASLNELISDCQFINNSGVSGGGVFSGTLNNCTLSGNASGNGVNNQGGGAFGSVLNYCTLTGNKTGYNVGTDGGGACSCTLNHCTINNNRADSDWSIGAGICSSVANDCSFSGNSGTYVWGGAAAFSSLTNCVMTGNTADNGGGGYQSTLVSCTLSGNVATWGGGSAGGTLYNCIILGNTGYQNGGGSYNGSLYNCTVVGNHCTEGAGGVEGYGAVNCIIVDNTSTFGAPNYSSATAIQYCCTTPMPTGGSGNVTDPPLFVNEAENDFHLLTNSPCVEAGTTTWGLTTTDFEGKPRLVGNAPDIGAYEFPTPTYFAIQPQSQTNYAGYITILTSLGVSPLPLHYQWEFNGIIMGGAMQSSLDLGPALPGYAGTFRVIISNPLVTVRSSNATLTVISPPPALLSQPLDLVANLGSNAVFSVSMFSPYPVGYQWQRDNTNLSDGGRISGTTSSNLVISALQSADAATYRVIVTNQYGAVTSSVASLTVLGPPILFSQPADTIVMVADFNFLTLSMTATGAPPLAIQWQKNGTNLVDDGHITGATGPTLTFPMQQVADSGIYRVVVSNAYGIISSTNAHVTVSPVLRWLTWPATPPPESTNFIEIATGADDLGDSFNLGLSANGTVTEWNYASPPPANATNVVAIAAGSYFGLALRKDGSIIGWGQNGYGQAAPPAGISNAVAIAAGVRHGLALLRDGTVAAWGDNSNGELSIPIDATNIVAISAGADFNIALRQDGKVLAWGANPTGQSAVPPDVTNVVAIAAGANNSVALRSDGTLTGWGPNWYVPPVWATNVMKLAAGDGHNLALRRDGTVVGWGRSDYIQTFITPGLTNVVSISANEVHSMAMVQHETTPGVRPAIVQQPLSLTLLRSASGGMRVNAIGSPPLSYQWLHGGLPVSGETNYWLWLNAVQPAQTGGYQVVVANSYGAVTSQVAVVTELPWATIASQPANQSAILNSNATFTVGMYGEPPFYYQWFFNGVPLIDNSHFIGAGSGSLMISNVQAADAGNYSVVVTNSSNSATSSAAQLTVLFPPAITNSPLDSSILITSNTAFSVGAAGTGTLTYQWLKSGTNLANDSRISGATTADLSISNAQTNDTGPYQVVVSNLYGVITSSVATLTVYAPVQITSQPASAAVLIGSNAVFNVGATGTLPHYQWLFNGAPLADNSRIIGTATASLMISNVQNADVGGYSVIVSNLFSSVTSATASLTPLTVATSSVRYVDLNSQSPALPYLNWSNAATTIQDAVDASVDGDLILVTNGLYQSGGKPVYGSLTNRVVVNKAITLRSVNGAASTIIQGNLAIGDSAVRPAYLTNNSSLIGFTIQYGAARSSGDPLREQSGGGVWCEGTNCFVINCNFVSNSVPQYGGGLYSGTSSNCTFVLNSANSGGGSFSGVLWNCTLATNTAATGGGACSNNLNSCSLLANKATGSGGGAYNCNLSNCIIFGNTNSGAGGGINSCIAIGCTLGSNTASANLGGGAYNSKLTNSFVLSNSAGRGGGVYSCVLNNSTVAGNFASDSGGSYQSTLDRCIVAWNRATSGTGGGGNGGTFVNCLIVSNSTATVGAGAFGAGLTNCTIVGHTNGSGVYNCSMKNCIVYFNTPNYQSGAVVNCCTTPLPVGPGQGSFTNAPLFADAAGGDFHLQPNSPCINAGANAPAVGNLDLDGHPRIVAATIDVGPYEFQTPASLLSYAWALQYGLPIDGSADFADADGDGMNNWREWVTGTNPTNALSVLKILSASRSATGLTVTWQSVNGLTYFLQRATNLAAQPAFSTIRSNLNSFFNPAAFTDTTATNAVPYFYRVGVQ